MSLAAILGAIVGLVLGVVDYLILGAGRDAVSARSGRREFSSLAFEAARISQLILFPVVGWFAGPFIVSALGG